MKPSRAIWGLVLLPILWSCSSMKIHTDYDHSVNFEALKTFAWSPKATVNLEHPQINDTALENDIQTSVEAQLRACDISKDSPEKADFLVVYYVTLENREEGSSGPYRSRSGAGAEGGSGGRDGWNEDQAFERNFKVGTLILNFVDPKSEKIFWRGTVEDEVNVFASDNRRQTRIRRAVRELLHGFPPNP